MESSTIPAHDRALEIAVPTDIMSAIDSRMRSIEFERSKTRAQLTKKVMKQKSAIMATHNGVSEGLMIPRGKLIMVTARVNLGLKKMISLRPT